MGAGCLTANNTNSSNNNNSAGTQRPVAVNKSLFTFGQAKRQPVYSYEGEYSLQKHTTPKRPNQNLMQSQVVRRPTREHLRLDTSDDEQERPTPLEIRVDRDFVERSRLGVYFQVDMLLGNLTQAELFTATKKLRIDKWHVMITYGFDQDIAHKVFKFKSKSEENSAKNRKINKFNHGSSYKADYKQMEPIWFSNYALVGLGNFFATNPELFLNRLAKGPPPQYRWLAWRFVASKLKPKITGDYEKFMRLGRSPSNKSCAQDIEKDIDRTFPQLHYFREGIGKDQLRNVLLTYSAFHPDVGYCQSINFLAGFLLLMSGANEKETFWFLNSFLETSKQLIPFDGLCGFYEAGFPLLLQYLAVFDDLFQEQMPVLHKHFQQEEMMSGMWIQKWFQSCFLYSFPLELCVRIWDNILACGTRFMFNVSLAILRSVEDRLLELDMAEINMLFKLFKKDEHMEEEQILPGVEEIIQNAQEIHFSNEKLHFLFEKHPVKRPQKEKAAMKQTLISEAPVRSQIFKSQAPKENDVAKDEKDMIGKKLEFDIEMDEAAPNRTVQGSARNELQPSPDQTIMSSQKLSSRKKKKKKHKKRPSEQTQLSVVLNQEKHIREKLEGENIGSKNNQTVKVENPGIRGDREDDLHSEIGSSLIKQDDINKINSFNPGMAHPSKQVTKNLIVDYNVPDSGTPLDNEMRADSNLLPAVNQDHQNGASSSMKIVTYPDQSKKKQKRKASAQQRGEEQSDCKQTASMNSVHLSVRNHNANQLRSGEFGNGSDSLQIGNESNRINDFVLQRESMNFKKVPSLNHMRGLDKSPTHSLDNRGSVDFRMVHGGSQLIEQQDSQGIQSARIVRVDNNTNGNITYSHVSSNNSNNEHNNQQSRPDKKAKIVTNSQANFVEQSKHMMTRQEMQLVRGRDPFRGNNFKNNYSQSLIIPNAAENQANLQRPPQIQRSIQFGGQGMAPRAIMGRGVSGIRSKPVLGDHMIIKRSNDIIEESIEDMNDDEHEYTRKYTSGFKEGARLPKVTEGLKDEFDDNQRSNDAFDAAKRESGLHTNFENDHMSIEHEDLSVSYQEEVNRGGSGLQQNRHRIIGRGAASSQTHQNVKGSVNPAPQQRGHGQRIINIDAPDSDSNNRGVVKDQFYQHHGSVGSYGNQSSSGGNVKSQGAVAAAINPATAHLSMSLVKTQIELGLQEQKNSGPFGVVDQRNKLRLSSIGRPANSEFEAYQRQQEHGDTSQRPLEVKHTSSPDEEMSLAGADREAMTVKNYNGA